MGDRWLYNGVVFFLLLPFSIFIALTNGTLIGSLVSVGFGGSLTVWRIAVTPEIRNRITFNVTLKGKKQVVKDSPGASLIQAENVYGLPDHEKNQLPDNLVKAYTSMRKTVKGWLDPRWSGFYDWSSLDEEDPRSVIQMRKIGSGSRGAL